MARINGNNIGKVEKVHTENSKVTKKSQDLVFFEKKITHNDIPSRDMTK